MKKTVECYTVMLSGQTVTYTLTRKDIKNINLRIKPDGSISISAPYATARSRIESFMVSKSDFILRNLHKIETRKTTIVAEQEYVDGDTFYLLGQKLILKVLEEQQERVWVTDSFLFLAIRNQRDKRRKQLLVEDFYEKQRVAVFGELIDEVYPIFRKFEVIYPTIKTRKMKTRWGSCIPSKHQITLNKVLIEVPKSCIKYVVLHEFAHFIHPNHSRDFYDFVSIYMSDWKEQKKLLAKFSFVIN